MQVHTVGHGQLPAEVLGGLLAHADVRRLVDVRRYPVSRRHPQHGREPISAWLAGIGVRYRWAEDLGGRRPARPDSANVALRNASFRGYADHMTSPGFGVAVEELLAEAAPGGLAVLCSEQLWWRCHRRLLADVLVLVHQVQVIHLDHRGGYGGHVITPGARRHGGLVRYDAGAQTLPAAGQD